MPTQSRLSAKDTTPHLKGYVQHQIHKNKTAEMLYLLMSPYDGLRPTIPQYDAGRRVDPPVSVDNALQDS